MPAISAEKRLEFYRDDISRTRRYLSNCPNGDPMVEGYLSELLIAVDILEKELGLKKKEVLLPEAVSTFVESCKVYAISCHKDVNHMYGKHPYEYHLSMVYDFAKKYIKLLPPRERKVVLASCWTHDLIEDCRQTYNDVKKICGEDVADITFALTNEKGKTRKDRGNVKYYAGIREIRAAWFVKLCDRLANINGSIEEGSSFTDMYRKEHDFFRGELYDIKFTSMFDEMEDMLFNKSK